MCGSAPVPGHCGERAGCGDQKSWAVQQSSGTCYCDALICRTSCFPIASGPRGPQQIIPELVLLPKPGVAFTPPKQPRLASRSLAPQGADGLGMVAGRLGVHGGGPRDGAWGSQHVVYLLPLPSGSFSAQAANFGVPSFSCGHAWRCVPQVAACICPCTMCSLTAPQYAHDPARLCNFHFPASTPNK